MTNATNYFYFASMDVIPEKEALLNEVYDTEHIPALLKVPGVISITRLKAQPFAFTMAGETRQIPVGDEPAYTAIYEIESPDVLVSEEWAAAVEVGRWPAEVRPYCSNRRQVLREVVASS